MNRGEARAQAAGELGYFTPWQDGQHLLVLVPLDTRVASIYGFAAEQGKKVLGIKRGRRGKLRGLVVKLLDPLLVPEPDDPTPAPADE